MIVQTTAIPGVLILEPKKHGDARGYFSETFKASVLREHGIAHGWDQDNHACSTRRGIIRGLHFQAPPAAQAKLVRVTRGAVFDVAIDIRAGSPTYGAHVAAELSADNWRQLYLPIGMAHAYCTLTHETEVLYKTSAEYAPASEGGLLWNDPALGIVWPVAAEEVTVNGRDGKWPRLRDFVTPFVY